MDKILIITGPTASGKTEFAIECAKRFNGEIISADSMQIYKGINIGTAKPTKQELAQVKHHLIDFIDLNKEYSVQQFVDSALKLIEQIKGRGKLPIVVGGTGLYIKSLIFPYSFCESPKSQEIREKYTNLLKEKGKEYLYNLLLKKDKDACQRIHINDTKRVIRALEICETTGKTKTQQNNEGLTPRFEYILVALTMDRSILYKRIDERVDKMFEKGLVNEITALIKNNLVDKSSQCMQAIGYKEFFKFLNGDSTLNETKELIKKNSRNYAKRQLTFIRGMPDVMWFDILNERDKAIDYIKLKLGE